MALSQERKDELAELEKQFGIMIDGLLTNKRLASHDDIENVNKYVKNLEAALAQKGKFGIDKPATEAASDPIFKALMDNKDQLEKFKRKEIQEVNFQVKTVGDMTFGTNYSGTPVATYASPVNGILGGSTRKVHVRQVLNLMPINEGSALPIIKDAGTSEGGFATVAEGAHKPEIDFDLSDATIKFKVLAAYATFTRQLWADVPNFYGWLSGKISEAYYKAEDTQLLSGDGTGENLSGLNLTGNFTAATATTGDMASRLVISITQLLAADREPSFILLHPSDIGDLVLSTATGSGEYTLPPGFSMNNGSFTVLGIPIYVSTAQTADTFNVIDRSGSFLAIREEMNIKLFEDSTLGKANKIMARCESRLALNVTNSSYNIKGSFA